MSSCSRRRVTPAWGSTPSCFRAFRPLVVASALAGFAPPIVWAQSQIEGEYGLRVTLTEEELGVGWLTSSAEPGVLEILSEGRTHFRAETPAQGAHFVTFPLPEAETIVLRYGAAQADDLHTTTIDLSEEPVVERGLLTGIDSLFVIGDIHGEFDRLIGLLRNGGLVDATGDWIAASRHVVFLGDVFDRGPDVTRTLWYLYGLERQARAAGGGAHVVLGNHETMIFTHDLRYVSAKEQFIAQLHGTSYWELFDIRSSVLGQWLVDRPVALRVDGALLAHGGILPEVGPPSVEVLNDSARAYMAEDLFYHFADPTVAVALDEVTAEAVRDQYSQVLVVDSASFARRTRLLFEDDGVLWFRGYVQSDTLGPALDQALDGYGAEVHVVAHTPVETIESRYDNRLIAVGLHEPAIEMLLLARDPGSGEYERWRIGLVGPPEPF